MSSVEVSGKGFLYDAAGTVPFFREGGIPDDMIVETLRRTRGVYEGRGTVVSDDEWQAALNHFQLPGSIVATPQPSEIGTPGQ